MRLAFGEIPTNMTRDLRLDTLRGLLLVLMTVNHFSWLLPDGWWGSHLTWQPLGYVSAAEGFVFLSGFTFALVSARYGGNSGLLWHKAYTRALLIYCYHLVMILGVAAVFWLVPPYRTVWAEWVSPSHEPPLASLTAMALLLHQPPYFDILPMYALLMLVSPLLLVFLFRRRHGVVLIASVAVWLLGQVIHPFAMATTLLFPSHQAAHFNVLSWQLLYVLGLFLGSDSGRQTAASLLTRTWLRRLIYLGTLLFLLSRHAVLLPELVDGIDRPSLQWGRLANVLLLTAIGGMVFPKISPRACVPWLAFLGQHSLQVFTFHVVAFYLLLPVTSAVVATWGSTGFLLVVALVVVGLWSVAWLHTIYQNALVPSLFVVAGRVRVP